jgi:YD repeat-containing protein
MERPLWKLAVMLVFASLASACALAVSVSLEPQDLDASWSAQRNMLAFVCYRPQRLPSTGFLEPYYGPYDAARGEVLREICVSDLDGGHRVQLTDNLAVDFDPVWSPDGEHIVFVSGEGASSALNVFVMSYDGADRTRLTQTEGGYRSPRWSPDGSSIAYLEGLAGADLYLIDTEGGQPARLTNGGGVISFDWSPDGEYIALERWDGEDEEVYLLEMATQTLVALTNNEVIDASPVWVSREGIIAFLSDRQGTPQIYAMDVRRGEVTLLSNESEEARSLSAAPTVGLVSYVSGRSNDQLLHVLDISTNLERSYSNFATTGSTPVWSPDGRYVFFERREDWNGDGFLEVKLWAMSTSNGERWPVSCCEWGFRASHAEPLQPSYAGVDFDGFLGRLFPDGSSVAYSSYIGGNARDGAMAVDVLGETDAYVAGSTASTNFPVMNPLQGTYAGGYKDAFIVRVTDETPPHEECRTITYDYDPLYRLTAPDYDDGTCYHHTYDPVENRLTETTEAGTTTYVYDDANRLTSVGGVPYAWSDNGNLLSDATYTYVYDHTNRLTSATWGTLTYGFAYRCNGVSIGLRDAWATG